MKKLPPRERLLVVMTCLQNHTSSQTPMSIYDIHSYVNEHGEASQSAIRGDLLVLEESLFFPVEVFDEREGITKLYYYAGRAFEIHELRLLLDAISAANFVTKPEKRTLFMKIRSLALPAYKSSLMNDLVLADSVVGEAVNMGETIQFLHNAVIKQQGITFTYGDFNIHKEFVLRYDGKRYAVQPYGLVWRNDRYYMVAYSLKDSEIRQYRLDRMRDIQLEETFFERPTDFSVEAHIAATSYMFSGRKVELKLRCEQGLINIVLEHFGMDVTITPLENNQFELKTITKESDGLVSWLLRYGAAIEVCEPECLRTRMKEEISKLSKKYKIT